MASNPIAGSLPNANQNALGLISGMPGSNINYAPQIMNAAKGIPAAQRLYQGQIMNGARQGATLGGNVASGIGSFAQGLVPYAQQIEAMGFDPQQALYNRTLQQVQDQQRAGQAARGIAMSPYGAGLENDATRNFNIDWQNNALSRAISAGQAASGLGSSAFNLGSGASDLAAKSATLPYAARTGLINDYTNAFSNAGQQVAASNAPRQQTIADYLQYLGMGPSYQNAASASQNSSTDLIGTIGKLALGSIGK